MAEVPYDISLIKTSRLRTKRRCLEFPRESEPHQPDSISTLDIISNMTSSTQVSQTSSKRPESQADIVSKKMPWKEIGQQMVTVFVPSADGSIKYKLGIQKRDLAMNAEVFKVLLFEKDRAGSRKTIDVSEVPGYDPNIHHPEAMKLVLLWMTSWRVVFGNSHHSLYLPGQVLRGHEDAKFAVQHPWIIRECEEDMLNIHACMRLFGHARRYCKLLLNKMTERPCQFPMPTVWHIFGVSEKDRSIFVHLLKIHLQRFHNGDKPADCEFGTQRALADLTRLAETETFLALLLEELKQSCEHCKHAFEMA